MYQGCAPVHVHACACGLAPQAAQHPGPGRHTRCTAAHSPPQLTLSSGPSMPPTPVHSLPVAPPPASCITTQPHAVQTCPFALAQDIPTAPPTPYPQLRRQPPARLHEVHVLHVGHVDCSQRVKPLLLHQPHHAHAHAVPLLQPRGARLRVRLACRGSGNVATCINTCKVLTLRSPERLVPRALPHASRTRHLIQHVGHQPHAASSLTCSPHHVSGDTCHVPCPHASRTRLLVQHVGHQPHAASSLTCSPHHVSGDTCHVPCPTRHAPVSLSSTFAISHGNLHCALSFRRLANP